MRSLHEVRMAMLYELAACPSLVDLIEVDPAQPTNLVTDMVDHHEIIASGFLLLPPPLPQRAASSHGLRVIYRQAERKGEKTRKDEEWWARTGLLFHAVSQQANP